MISLHVLDPITGARVAAELTTRHPASSRGLPVLLLYGEPVDWKAFRPAEGLDVLFSRVYTAGVADGRRSAEVDV
jgi:hypothetical protein